MYNTHRNILVAAICLLTFWVCESCTSGKEAYSGNKKEKVEASENVVEQGPVLKGCVPLQSQGVVTLRTPDEVVLGQIMSVNIVDTKFVVQDDRDCVYGFNFDGSYICKYGNRGEGPEEYVTLGAVSISPHKEVVVVDSYMQRMLYFDLNTGRFVKKTVFPSGSFDMTYACSFLSDTTAVLSRRIFNNDNRVYAVANLNSLSVKTFDSVPMTTSNIGVPLGVHNLSVFGGEVYYLKPFDPTIYRMPGKSWLKIPTKQKILSRKQMGEIRDFSVTTGVMKSVNENVFPGYTDIFVMDGYVFLGLLDWEYAVLNLADGVMQRYKYQKDDDMNYIGLSRIIAADAEKNILVGVSSSLGLEEDRLYVYTLNNK